MNSTASFHEFLQTSSFLMRIFHNNIGSFTGFSIICSKPQSTLNAEFFVEFSIHFSTILMEILWVFFEKIFKMNFESEIIKMYTDIVYSNGFSFINKLNIIYHTQPEPRKTLQQLLTIS